MLAAMVRVKRPEAVPSRNVFDNSKIRVNPLLYYQDGA
jgi:hypothetical protein